MKSIRNTFSKLAVQKLLQESTEALSHAEIRIALNGICDRVTIYRILNRLIDEKSIHKMATIDGVVKYAKCHKYTSEIHNHTHIHFSCEKCKKVICLEAVEVQFNLPSDYIANEMNFNVSGICKNCKN